MTARDTMPDTIHLLHVDDEPGALSTTENYFERFHDGIAIETTTDPESAVDRVRGSDIECVLCDYDMPEMDGLAVLETIRAAGLSQPFILYTGKGSEDVASEAISAGVTDYVEKGESTGHFAVLANRIENAVARYRNEQRREAAAARSGDEGRADHERALARYEAIVESITDAAVVIDRDWEIAYANEYALERADMTLDAICGTDTLAMADRLFVSQEKVDYYESLLADVFEQGRAIEDPCSFEVTVDLPNGEAVREYRLSPMEIDGEVEAVVLLARDITARRERERELERFEEIVSVVDDGVYALDDEGEFTMVNDAMTGLTGYDREELLGKHTRIIKDEATVEKAEDALRRLLSGEEAETTFELPLQPKAGADIACEDHMTVRYDEDSRFVGTAGIIRDISTQKERRQKLAGMVETTQQLVSLHDRQAIVETTLTAAREGLGFEMGAIRLYDEESDMLEVVAQQPSPADAPEERPAYEVGEPPTGEAFETDTPIVRDRLDDHDDIDSGRAASGLYVPISDHGTLSLGSPDPEAFDDLDVQVASVLAASTATALDRLERERDLRLERNRIEALFETVPEPIVQVRFEDGAPVAKRLNEAFVDVFGFEESEIVGANLNEYILPDGERETGRRIDDRSLERQPVEQQVRRLTADGERDFLFRSVPLPTAGSDGTAEAVSVYVDITDQKEVERELQRQNDRLERFASTVSHDLRNPLRIAKSHLDMATRECETDLLDDVAAAHDRMEELIADLLALARQGQSVDETESLSLAALAEDAWGNVDAPDATLAVETEASVAADESRLLQAFENLFRNSAEHGPDGVTVRVGDTAAGFYIEDDGPGIPADEQEAVFEYGYTTADTGTGFGLAIVQEVAQAHGWSVSVAASSDGGARFEFRT